MVCRRSKHFTVKRVNSKKNSKESFASSAHTAWATGRGKPPSVQLFCRRDSCLFKADAWCLFIITNCVHHHSSHPIILCLALAVSQPSLLEQKKMAETTLAQTHGPSLPAFWMQSREAGYDEKRAWLWVWILARSTHQLTDFEKVTPALWRFVFSSIKWA